MMRTMTMFVIIFILLYIMSTLNEFGYRHIKIMIIKET